ncbi:MAG: penicillin-binding protein 2 [Patescibacteria group bacterium]|nr:penicillin-binding protein 2 [Patescibacteria group bacterium]
MKAETTPRIHILFSVILLFAIILVGRLFFLQIVHGQAYQEMADSQYVTSVSNIYERGSIFFQDRRGQLVSAATLKSGYIVSINPSIMENPEEVYEKIQKIIPLEKESFFAKAAKEKDPYEEIARRVAEETAFTVRDLEIPSVSIQKEKWRFYPAGKAAAHILGFVGYNGDVLSGRYGLERYYNDILTRTNENLHINFFAEIFSNITDSILKSDNSREGDLVLTIEYNVQLALEATLAQVMEDWSSESVGGIIINPTDGRVYAMASLPNFDPNLFQKEESSAVFSNPIAENVYEMGSIIKPLTMAAALDVGAVTAHTTYNDKGYINLNGYKIANYDGESRGVVSMQEVLNQSLNTGVVFAEQTMGGEVFRSYMEAYGIDKETGIDVPNETKGLTDNLKSGREVEYATASFGQGIALSPIATARALSTLGNGGLLIEPYLVDRIDYKNWGSKKTYPDEGVRVLKKETSEEITRMLVKVVDDALLGGTVALPHYSVAAKTGTAQIADPREGGYYNDRYLHSFFGYFPAYNPQFLIFLYNVNPKEVRYASQTLTSPFVDLTKFLINYYEIPPDR